MDLMRDKKRAREVFEKTYNDRATIKIYQKQVIDGLTKTVLVPIYENVPCNLAFKYKYNAVDTKVYGEMYAEILLMISPDLDIPLNSDVEVIRNGETFIFSSANSMKFITHQAVFLKLKDNIA